jgi:transcriptional repressor NrdR
MRCPNCKNVYTACLDSREDENNTRRRRRECPACGCRFTTIEICADTYDKQVKVSALVAELIKAGVSHECK